MFIHFKINDKHAVPKDKYNFSNISQSYILYDITTPSVGNYLDNIFHLIIVFR